MLCSCPFHICAEHLKRLHVHIFSFEQISLSPSYTSEVHEEPLAIGNENSSLCNYKCRFIGSAGEQNFFELFLRFRNGPEIHRTEMIFACRPRFIKKYSIQQLDNNWPVLDPPSPTKNGIFSCEESNNHNTEITRTLVVCVDNGEKYLYFTSYSDS